MERYDSEGRLVEWITNIGDGVKTISYAYHANGVMDTQTTVEANDLKKITTVDVWLVQSVAKKTFITVEDIEEGTVTTVEKVYQGGLSFSVERVADHA